MLLMSYNGDNCIIVRTLIITNPFVDNRGVHRPGKITKVKSYTTFNLFYVIQGSPIEPIVILWVRVICYDLDQEAKTLRTTDLYSKNYEYEIILMNLKQKLFNVPA